MYTEPINEPELRIIGGYDAKPGQYPYLVSLQIISLGNLHWCAGSIIDKSWILIAAHCVKVSKSNTYNNLKIKAGKHNISEVHEVYEQEAEIDKIFQHNSYSRIYPSRNARYV